MTLNHELICGRFNDISQSLTRLEEVRALSIDEFLADQDTQDIACYRLLVAIESALQICFHVNARMLQRVPEEYSECFELLGKSGVLPEDLARRLQAMARFRNSLVHMYWRVDYGMVYSLLHTSLDDLRQFIRAIGTLL